jgi:MFS family permease
MNPSSDKSIAVRPNHLLLNRRFCPLFITQFFGAFNDNLFKNALVVLLTYQAANWTTLRPEVLANVAAGLFILPFFLFSATAGQLADKFDKARLARYTKLLEIAIVLFAALGFTLKNLPLLFIALFLLGLQSTLFGPVKYAILPQHLAPNELVGGNALVEAGTFVAILFGTLTGGLLAGFSGGTVWISLVALAVALVGYLASRGIPAAPAPEPGLKINPNPMAETWRCLQFARENRAVFLSILGISWFWLYGSLFLTQFPAYTKTVLGGGESMVTLLLAVFSIGIGTGSLFCEKLSRHKLEIGLVPFGALGMTLFGLDLAWASPAQVELAGLANPLPLATLLADPGVWRVLVDLFLLSACGGVYCVPLYTLVQQRSNPARRARVIAANNILNAFFMVAGALLAVLLLTKGGTITLLFMTAAFANALVATYIFTLVPEFLIRALVKLGLRTEPSNEP